MNHEPQKIKTMIKEIKINVNGTYNNAAIYIPDNATGKLPAIAFVPGIGEQNSNISGLYVWGPLAFINNGWKPDFIVIGIQPAGAWPQPPWIDLMIDYLVKQFPVIDPAKIVHTGLSAGANAILGNAASPGIIYKPAAIIAFSYGWSSPITAYKDIPMWGLCGDADVAHYGFMSYFWKLLQDAGYKEKPFTIMHGYGHGGWNDFYNPVPTVPDLKSSIYDWMKLFAPLPVVQPTPAPAPAPVKTVKAVIDVYNDGSIDVVNK